MKLSARNQLPATVVAITRGEATANVEARLTAPGPRCQAAGTSQVVGVDDLPRPEAFAACRDAVVAARVRALVR